MKKNNPSVAIAVCAYNEAKNIRAFLESVLMQNTSGYRLQKIVVVSDGSTDGTVAIAKEIQRSNPIIEIIDHRRRIGKSSHLNRIYKNLRSDFFIQTDADVIFADRYVVQRMVKPLQANSVSMTCGNPLPLPASTYTESAYGLAFRSISKTHKALRGGQNAFIADGRILAYRSDFIKKVTVPYDMIANDLFTYFACRKRRLKAIFIPHAIVYFRGPKTLQDIKRQTARSAAARLRMIQCFSKELVEWEMRIPFIVSLKSKIQQFFRAPIMSLYTFIIYKYCELKAEDYNRSLNAIWPMAKTTKKLLKDL